MNEKIVQLRIFWLIREGKFVGFENYSDFRMGSNSVETLWIVYDFERERYYEVQTGLIRFKLTSYLNNFINFLNYVDANDVTKTATLRKTLCGVVWRHKDVSTIPLGNTAEKHSLGAYQIFSALLIINISFKLLSFETNSNGIFSYLGPDVYI